MATEIIGATTPYETAGGGFSAGLSESRTEQYVGEKTEIEAKARTYMPGGTAYASNISNVSVRDMGDGMAELTVTYSTVTKVGEVDKQEPEANWEITYVQDNLPLAMHPMFPDSKLDEWRKFLASPEMVQAKNKYLVDPDDVNSKQEDISDEISGAAELFNKGIQTFVTYNPVVSKVQVYDHEPDTMTTIGMREKPSKWSHLAKDWLKTADSLSFDGNVKTWTRTQQWTGAYEWSPRLYNVSPIIGGSN